MKTVHTHSSLLVVFLMALGLFLAGRVFAQQTGFRPSAMQNRSSGNSAYSGNSSGALQYNANGAVGNATISFDPDTHNVTILADEETTRHIAEVITNLDRPQPQVLIKVVFMQLTHSDDLDLGVEGGWMNGLGGSLKGAAANSFGLSSLSSGTGSNAPVLNAMGLPISGFPSMAPFVGGAGAGMYQILGNDFQATLRAIAASGKAEILARPSILARNNQPASVVIGQYVPLITSVSYNSVSGEPINSITYTAVGIILTVTPYITNDGLVQMIIAPQNSSVDSSSTVQITQGVNAPVIDTVAANTVAITPSGQTVVIGGLMQRSKAESVSKIPILGDIPWLGNLFKRTTTSMNKEELLIFLTPYVVQAPSQLVTLSAIEQGRVVVPKSYSEKELDTLLDKIPVKQTNAPAIFKPDNR